MRSQLTSLKALIDAIVSIIAAQVDGTTTLNPGDPAFVTLTVDGSLLRFSFGIPRGQEGLAGQNGQDGGIGPMGPQGPPFAQAIVDAVNTLNPGESAWVTVTFDGTYVHFTFGIPRGAEGIQGPQGQQGIQGEQGNQGLQGIQGDQGIQGEQGIQGPPGEVTTAALNTAIATTAQNPAAVSPLSQTADGTYNPTQMQQVMDKLDELLAATKRQ